VDRLTIRLASRLLRMILVISADRAGRGKCKGSDVRGGSRCVVDDLGLLTGGRADGSVGEGDRVTMRLVVSYWVK